jgi:hypothetical protein
LSYLTSCVTKLYNSYVFFLKFCFLDPITSKPISEIGKVAGGFRPLNSRKFNGKALYTLELNAMDFSTVNLAVIELVIFTFALLLSFWHVVKHGFDVSMKWPILLLAVLHVFASSYQISTNGNGNDAVEITDAGGLFLILSAFTGILEEL